MHDEVLVTVDNISKKFCRDLKRSLWYGVQDIARELVNSNHVNTTLRKEEFWAVRNVSFELRRGECLGLIGHNGAGKSTLLKMINGLIKPDVGAITIKGRVGALIELGAGFDPILTGRENIYINGQILGFTKKEVDKKFDSIVDFSGISQFIDTPVRNYSSGMKVRLGFSVAIHMEPDVLLVDEVLAVGDLAFVIKSLNAMQQLMKKCAVIFVTHSMPLMSRVCTRSILMDSGKVKSDSKKIGEVIEQYTSRLRTGNSTIVGNPDVQIENVALHDPMGQRIDSIKHYTQLWLKFTCTLPSDIDAFNVRAIIRNIEQRSVLEYYSGIDNNWLCNHDNRIDVTLDMGTVMLNTGKYSISLVVLSKEGDYVYYRIDNAKEFTVVSDYTSWSDFNVRGNWKIK